MDRRAFLSVNRFADRTGWLHPAAVAYAKYGVVVFAALLLLAWFNERRAENLDGQAGAVWAAAAAAIALGIGQIVGALIDRARPYDTLHGVSLLVSRTSDFSMPSDHATAAGAAAVGLLYVNRRIGIVATVLAVLMAATRVYVGAHYPADVLAGLALGAGVAAAGSTVGRRASEWLLIAISRLPVGRTLVGQPVTVPTSFQP